ncbi:hypothetical protein OPV22_007165 [Ensete ventricosum]|uniref:Uncharacterized protein n=1 Tax=Ensete ventricosum TaxID=4639 RepID=A0A444EQ28_ENSVE|nr:hypothetical protein OPV22_007165 [Ensete ventricosum]RRT34693.1 hypothetical protein B296_00053611 [Ensete ventricosum]RWW12467.1 hypothetical protein GW17_00023865 [Ensete ventricosum]RWW83529.1 hypothetical protein BHE74_00007953 [Ensete ventricosum]RZR83637.1 hypothetical protein BHM03_00010312 [Ensete ventricosum]
MDGPVSVICFDNEINAEGSTIRDAAFLQATPRLSLAQEQRSRRRPRRSRLLRSRTHRTWWRWQQRRWSGRLGGLQQSPPSSSTYAILVLPFRMLQSITRFVSHSIMPAPLARSGETLR